MIRKVASFIAIAGAFSLTGCSSSDNSPFAPSVPETAPVATAQSVATVGLLGAQVAVDGALLVVPPGALPVGTQVRLNVWSFGPETHYDVDLGGGSSFLPAILTINAAGEGQVSLLAKTGGTWNLIATSLSGLFTHPLSAAASLKTTRDDL